MVERRNDEITPVDSRFMAITQSTVNDNVAKLTGGAIFVSNLDSLIICCNCSLGIKEVLGKRFVDRRPEVVSVKKNNLSSQINDAHPCKESWLNNSARKGDAGDVVGTMAVKANAFVGGLESSTKKNASLRLRNHTSGRDLEPIFIRLVDAFDSPAYGQPKMLAQITADSPNVTLSGQLIVNAEVVTTLTSIRLQAKVNNSYNLTLSFNPSILSNISIQVDVRDCIPGETLELGDELCIPCGEDLYSFNVHHSCKGCPINAECKYSTITPQKAYWHSTSKSIQIHKCLTRGACDYKDREKGLERQARNAHIHGLVLGYENNTAYKQCSEV